MNYLWIILIVADIILIHLVAYYVGRKRKIGYGKTVFWSVLLSPLIGFFIASLSPLNNDTIK